jgi:single-stranded-DNA-specific exonuclease
LLKIRKIKNQKDFLNPDFEKHSHAPSDLKDLIKAVERIEHAVKKNERILIIGDYDADGICASVILFRTLQTLGAEVSVRLPHRLHHGYGLNPEFIEEAQKLKVGLVITVDNGISAKPEVELANSFGIDVIVTDHHLPPAELPPALAILNPRQDDCDYPDKLLSGSGVALKLAFALLEVENPSRQNDFLKLRGELIVFATIGTLADVCELTGENRAMVNEGLRKIKSVKVPGLQRILFNAGLKDKKIVAEDVGFRIAPRLNAAGRIGDPLLAFRALTDATGTELADQLEALNSERQQLTQTHLQEAEEQLDNVNKAKILIAGGKNLHPGIIGLIAGRLAEKYHRPAVIMSESENNLTGSCRSPLSKFNITEALSHNAALLKKFGGHRCAAGFTLAKEHQSKLENGLIDFADQAITAQELISILTLDFSVNEADISFDFFSELQRLAPFGEGNPEPVLFWENAKISQLQSVGENGDHLRLKIGDKNHTAIAFRFGKFIETLQKRPTADLAFTLGENVWNGKKDLQLKIVDIR